MAPAVSCEAGASKSQYYTKNGKELVVPGIKFAKILDRANSAMKNNTPEQKLAVERLLTILFTQEFTYEVKREIVRYFSLTPGDPDDIRATILGRIAAFFGSNPPPHFQLLWCMYKHFEVTSELWRKLGTEINQEVYAKKYLKLWSGPVPELSRAECFAIDHWTLVAQRKREKKENVSIPTDFNQACPAAESGLEQSRVIECLVRYAGTGVLIMLAGDYDWDNATKEVDRSTLEAALEAVKRDNATKKALKALRKLEPIYDAVGAQTKLTMVSFAKKLDLDDKSRHATTEDAIDALRMRSLEDMMML